MNSETMMCCLLRFYSPISHPSLVYEWQPKCENFTDSSSGRMLIPQVTRARYVALVECIMLGSAMCRSAMDLFVYVQSYSYVYIDRKETLNKIPMIFLEYINDAYFIKIELGFIGKFTSFF